VPVSRSDKTVNVPAAPIKAGENLRVWVLTDGKIGDDVQCLGVASALDPAFEKRVVDPRPFWAALAPWGPVDPAERPGRAGGPLAGPPPAVAVISGRRAIPYGRALKKASGGATKIVILKDPRVSRGVADFLWAPAHDRVSGANSFSTLTSPHGLAAVLASDAPPCEAIASLEKPMLGLILGGVTAGGGIDYSVAAAEDLAQRVSDAAKEYASLAVTPSRRTPPAFLEALKRAIVHDGLFAWDRQGANPYADILKHSGALIVAGDSHNMMSEALASKAAVYIWRPNGLAAKMNWFIDTVAGEGSARIFEDSAPVFARRPVDATAEIVAEIRTRFGLVPDAD